MVHWLKHLPRNPGVAGSIPGFSSPSDETINRGSQTTFHDNQPTRTNCDEGGDYAVPNMLSPRDLVFRPGLWTKKLYTHTQLSSVILYLPRSKAG